MTKPKIKVDIVSDVVCPWCYIGKRRVEKAMDALQDKYDFEVVYHPFELNPQMPAEGVIKRNIYPRNSEAKTGILKSPPIRQKSLHRKG
jgi:predicted DsbA family dithiol-disulfide isomerase